MGSKPIISLGLAMLFAVQLWAIGCSQRDSQEEESGPQKVVVKIQRPAEVPESVKSQEATNLSDSKETQEVDKEALKPVIEQNESAAQTVQEGQSNNNEGWYRVTDKDTLIVVAGSSRVYSDPYKWLSLLRLNLQTLEPLGLSPGVETRELSPGLRLRYLTPTEVEQRRKELQGRKWVVNILSDKRMEKISGLAIKLIKNGIPVYITKAEVKGEQWFRLRTGFFATLEEAKEMKDRVEKIIGVKGLWVAKISDEEFDRYAGY